MSPDQRLASMEAKLNLLVAHFVPTEKVREAELEAQYLEAARVVSDNPALIREFVQQHPDWVAGRSKRGASVSNHTA